MSLDPLAPGTLALAEEFGLSKDEYGLVLEKLGRTPAQIALAWTLSVAPNVLLISGTSSVAHLEENTAVRDITLDDETKKQLDAAA